MPRGQWLTPHQKGIVRRYYEHKDTLATQKLSETLSELYLCKDERRAAKLWQVVQTALINAGVHKGRAERIVVDRDLKGLGRAIAELF